MKHSHIIIICIGLFCISSYLLYVSEGGLSFERPGSFVGFSDSLIHDNTTEKIPKKFIAVQYCAKNPKIRFFMYHYIRNDDPLDTIGTHNLSIPPSIFDGQMNMIEKLSQSGSITLMKGEDFLSSLKSSCYPSENIWIFTDDDGWSDSHSDLMPIAANHSIPFFFGIIGNRIDKHGFVTSGEVRSLASNPLFTISSHSLTHADESKMSIENEQKEMCESKKILENIIGKSVNTYIYPSGRMNASGSTQNLKTCGYTIAWTTSFGRDFDMRNPHFSEINRIRVGRDDGKAFFEKYLNIH